MSNDDLLRPGPDSELQNFERDLKAFAPAFEALDVCEASAGPELIIKNLIKKNSRAFVMKYKGLVIDFATELFVSKRPDLSVGSIDGSERITISSARIIKLDLSMAIGQQENPILADAVSLALVMALLPAVSDVSYSQKAADAGLDVAIFNSDKYRRSAVDDLLRVSSFVNRKKNYSWVMWGGVFVAVNFLFFYFHVIRR